MTALRCRHGAAAARCVPCHKELLEEVLQWMRDADMPTDEDESVLMTRIGSVLANGREPV